MSYARFKRMTDAARPYPALWRLFLGLITAMIVAFAWMAGVVWAVAFLTGSDTMGTFVGMIEPGTTSPGTTALYLFLIVGTGLGAVVAAAIWHKRRPGTLFGPGARTLRHFAISAALSLGAMVLLALVFLPFIERPEVNMTFGLWLLWLPVGILALIAQTGAEEVLFRGYIQSQLGARFKSPAIWLFLPALLFGAIHYQPQMPDHLVFTIIIVATVFGLLAGDLTARTGSIGAAWGFHFANNALVILLVAADGSLTGLGLFKSEMNFEDLAVLSPLIVVEILTLTAIWALIRRVLAS